MQTILASKAFKLWRNLLNTHTQYNNLKCFPILYSISNLDCTVPGVFQLSSTVWLGLYRGHYIFNFTMFLKIIALLFNSKYLILILNSFNIIYLYIPHLLKHFMIKNYPLESSLLSINKRCFNIFHQSKSYCIAIKRKYFYISKYKRWS